MPPPTAPPGAVASGSPRASTAIGMTAHMMMAAHRGPGRGVDDGHPERMETPDPPPLLLSAEVAGDLQGLSGRKTFTPAFPNEMKNAFCTLAVLFVLSVGVRAYADSSEEYCKQNPYDSDCSSSEAYCSINPYSASCGSSESYCKVNPYSSSCGSSGAYCSINPYSSSCGVSGPYCKINPYSSSCGSSEAYCSINPYSTGCGSSETYCKINPYSSSCTKLQ